LIIKIKNIHELNVLRLNLWILSIKKSNILHWHTLPCFHPLAMHEGIHALFDEEDHSDFFNDLDEEMEELINDEQGKLFLQNNIG
jgi:hypothetical protein